MIVKNKSKTKTLASQCFPLFEPTHNSNLHGHFTFYKVLLHFKKNKLLYQGSSTYITWLNHEDYGFSK
jgi:hypothetical protein